MDENDFIEILLKRIEKLSSERDVWNSRCNEARGKLKNINEIHDGEVRRVKGELETYKCIVEDQRIAIKKLKGEA